MPFGRQLPCKWPAIGRQLQPEMAGNCSPKWPAIGRHFAGQIGLHKVCKKKSIDFFHGGRLPYDSAANGRQLATEIDGQIGLHLVCKNKSKDLFHVPYDSAANGHRNLAANRQQIGSKFAPKIAAKRCAKINLKIYFTRVLLPYDSAANGHRK